MYNDITNPNDGLWVILEDGINIQVNGAGMVSDKKSLTPAQKMIYIKHHRVKGILVDPLPHLEYFKIIDKSISKTILNPYALHMKGTNKSRKQRLTS